MLTAQDNATIAHALYDACNRRDMETSLALVTDDAKWMNVPFNVNFSGRSGYREYLDSWTTAMPDFKVTVTNVVGAHEWTVVEFVGSGTHTGPFAGHHGTFRPTQGKLDLKFCEFLRFRDGQIAEAHVYFDAATLLRQFCLPAQPLTPAQQATRDR